MLAVYSLECLQSASVGPSTSYYANGGAIVCLAFSRWFLTWKPMIMASGTAKDNMFSVLRHKPTVSLYSLDKIEAEKAALKVKPIAKAVEKKRNRA